MLLMLTSLGVDSHVIRMVHNSEPDPITRLEVTFSITVCPGSSDLFYIVTNYIKWVLLPGHAVVSLNCSLSILFSSSSLSLSVGVHACRKQVFS